MPQLADDFARYLYLLRLQSPAVLIEAVRNGVQLRTWMQDTFAYADSFDEAADRYRGLRAAELLSGSDDAVAGLLVHTDVAVEQLRAEREQQQQVGAGSPGASPGEHKGETAPGGPETPPPPPEPSGPRRYHGSVVLGTTRVGADAGRIATEVISHLAALQGAEVRVTLEIEATFRDPVPDHVVRTVTENGYTLKFQSHGFERE